jgi:hypothetical protein
MNVGDIVTYQSPSPRYGSRWGVVLGVDANYPHLHIGYYGGDHDDYHHDDPRLTFIQTGDVALVEAWYATGNFPIDLETGKVWEP